jgi:predicted DNA-binding antitoxin AbrB/MazE fold protein
MTMTILAIYENGVLRSTTPLALTEGETVHLAVTPTKGAGPVIESRLESKSPAEAEAIRRIKATKTIEELFSVVESLPQQTDDGYDFLQALNDNRAPGERPLFPPELKGITW